MQKKREKKIQTEGGRRNLEKKGEENKRGSLPIMLRARK